MGDTLTDVASKVLAQTSPMFGRFAPNTIEFDDLLRAFERNGVPMVGVGRRYGPRLPQIADASPSAPAPIEVDRDVERVAKARWSWAQPWHPDTVTLENRKDVIHRTTLWSPPAKWHPRRRLSMQMWASTSRHLRLATDAEIAEMAGLRGETIYNNTTTMRLRDVHGIVERGDALWAAYGAWPWASFVGGRVPDEWWTLDEPWRSLHDAVRAHEDLARERLEHLKLLSASLGGEPSKARGQPTP